MVTKISDVKMGDWYFKCLITGIPGTRKTTAACSFPGRVLLIDIDKKGYAMALPLSKGLVNPDMEYEPYDSWFKIQDKLNRLQSNCPYDLVIADSVTSAGDVINRSTIKAKQGGKKIAGISVNSIEDFNAETSALMELVTLGLSLPCHFILIAHVIQRGQDNQTPRTIVTGGKIVAAKLPAYFPEVFHFKSSPSLMEGGPTEFEAMTQNSGIDFARTTLPLPSVFSWTDKNFYETMMGHMQGVELKGGKNKQTQSTQL